MSTAPDWHAETICQWKARTAGCSERSSSPDSASAENSQ